MGTVLQQGKSPYKYRYGSFDKTKLNVKKIKEKHTKIPVNEDKAQQKEPKQQKSTDNDSGMSSEECDDSLKCNLLTTNDNKYNDIENVSANLDVKPDIITKCLNTELHSASWNEIPSCSNDIVNICVNEVDTSGLDLDEAPDDTDNVISDFIVIDLALDAKKSRDLHIDKVVASTSYSGVHNVSDNLNDGAGQRIVPVTNNELVKSEKQKLVSLSLSILLAAILQAMRCFAQFLEDIVVPQR